jgi:23S rRNA (guanine2445-N2)-methyltransferase / 23S rRNA (guanine2069-N7)-methyltransferase
LLAPGGELLFSTNFSRFALAADELSGFSAEDITRETLPRDFERNPRIHTCYLLRRAGDAAPRR